MKKFKIKSLYAMTLLYSLYGSVVVAGGGGPGKDPAQEPKLPAVKPLSFSDFYNDELFFVDELSLTNAEKRTIFQVPTSIQDNKIVESIENYSGSELVINAKGYDANGELVAFGAELSGNVSNALLEMSFIQYRDIKLTDSELEDLRSIHALGDSIASAKALYGYGIQLTCDIKTNSSGAKMSAGIGAVAANADVGFYDVEIKQKIMGGIDSDLVTELLKVATNTDNIETSHVVLSALTKGYKLIKPVEVKRLGYYVKINKSKLQDEAVVEVVHQKLIDPTVKQQTTSYFNDVQQSQLNYLNSAE